MSALPVVSEIRHNLETMQPQFAAALELTAADATVSRFLRR